MREADKPVDSGGPTAGPGPGGDRPPPGPARPEFWRSPLRGPWLTAVLGLVLLGGVVVMFVTGLLSYAAYDPDLARLNDQTPDKGLLGFYLFDWPTSPYWLYRLTQGVHVTLGIVLVPVLLAKLWSVIPKLFAWPPVRSAGQALERVSLLLLVGGVIFEFVTGILNIQLYYVFPGSFYTLHFYGAWVFAGAFVVHVAFRLGRALRAVRAGPAGEYAASDDSGLVTPAPAPPTVSRRGALGMVGAGSAALLVVTVGQSVGGPLRTTALLAPHGQDPGPGENGFQINKTAAAVGIRDADIGPHWRLTVRGGGRQAVLTYDELLALPRHRAALPIACVEGWSTDDQLWSGVRLTDLAGLVGLRERTPHVLVESVQRGGPFSSVVLAAAQARDDRSLLAVRVNGGVLSRDHGYPARIIVPGAPGVHNTKWVTRLSFGEPA
ncbi:molybdopterin-dependent oxidoreductase [Streptantibioticus silvisoli]|uniref:Molybdopterin-dependent oxidoreductase n=1 Tax=Streptantibioticus silvisoli TaxID=2705255 RepID=A0ABT6W1B0_9ACTN|nr:molybdopterin-dependent oxidoreductase [Streptantibioticus silvisoli]MDI5964464.1 molybdopterin-dependent oxidoreductase [Streptantibioticus silvisoli]